MDPDAADDAPRPDEIVGGPQGRTQADDLDDGVCAAAVARLLDALQHALLIRHEVQRLGAELLGQLEPALDAVDGEEMLGLVLQGRDDGAQPHGAAADDHDGRLGRRHGLQHAEGILGAEETRREDVGHEHQGLVVDLGWCLDRGAVGEGDPGVLGLAAVQERGPEQIAVGAAGGEAVAAVEAFRAAERVSRCRCIGGRGSLLVLRAPHVPGRGEGSHHLISDLERLHLGPDFGDDAGELMPHDKARRRRLMSPIDVQLPMDIG